MLTVVCIIGLLVGSGAGFLDGLFDNHVCYDDLGCFSINAPFTNTWRQLPDSPEDIGVTLTLYTRADPEQGEALNYKDAKTVADTRFDPSAETKIIVHGFINDGTEAWVVDLRSALLQEGPFNVIKVAWGPGAHAMYPKAVANTRVVGAVIASLLTSLRDELNVSMSRVHLLGHSLGVHISGYAGSRVPGVGRISGLDPAGPLFESADPAVRIDPTDASFVDCIHSDGLPLKDLGFGTMSAWCDADFYPNGGGFQPGCPKPVSHTLGDLFTLKVEAAEDDVSCSHSRSHELYTSSIRQCHFPSTPCSSFSAFQAGTCKCPPSGCPSMGYHAADSGPRPSGAYYLYTTGTQPYC